MAYEALHDTSTPSTATATTGDGAVDAGSVVCLNNVRSAAAGCESTHAAAVCRIAARTPASPPLEYAPSSVEAAT